MSAEYQRRSAWEKKKNAWTGLERRNSVMPCSVPPVSLAAAAPSNCEDHLRQSAVQVKDRAVFKWLSKVITWLRLLRLVVGLKDSRQFFNQWESKPKPIAPCTRDFSRASSELQVIATNSDWFMALFVPVVIDQSDYFGFGFSTVIWKPLYWWNKIVSVSKVLRGAVVHNWLLRQLRRKLWTRLLD